MTRPEVTPADLMQFVIAPPDNAPLSFAGPRQDLVISPDGTQVVYVGPAPGGGGHSSICAATPSELMPTSSDPSAHGSVLLSEGAACLTPLPMSVHDRRNPCSRCPESVFNLPGIRVHVRVESVFKIVRNTHRALRG